MLHAPFYDPGKSYEDNYDKGPFGEFTDKKVIKQTGAPKHDFLGQKVYLPFGIPAGPLLNSNFCKSAFEKGFDICVYKTVRSGIYSTHPFPNVLAVKIDGDLTLEKAKGQLVADDNYSTPLSITNSFGVPSKDPTTWQKDVKKAMSFVDKGQVLVLSFMGTVMEGQTAQEFVADFGLAAKFAKETGAKVYEINLSCPNIGNEGLVCYNLEMTEMVCKAVRKELGDSPLVLKVGYYQNDEDIKKLVKIAAKYAQSISGINTISAEIVDKDGKQALIGKPIRLRSGVCGAAIKWAGIETVQRLKKEIKKQKVDLKVDGVGGVTVPEDYFNYIEAGADAVMSATGAMWDPFLAQEIKKLDK